MDAVASASLTSDADAVGAACVGPVGAVNAVADGIPWSIGRPLSVNCKFSFRKLNKSGVQTISSLFPTPLFGATLSRFRTFSVRVRVAISSNLADRLVSGLLLPPLIFAGIGLITFVIWLLLIADLAIPVTGLRATAAAGLTLADLLDVLIFFNLHFCPTSSLFESESEVVSISR